MREEGQAHARASPIQLHLDLTFVHDLVTMEFSGRIRLRQKCNVVIQGNYVSVLRAPYLVGSLPASPLIEFVISSALHLPYNGVGNWLPLPLVLLPSLFLC